MATRPPYEVARETVKALATRKLVPTPDNYQSVYHEIAGTKPLRPFPEEPLQQIARALPTQTPAQQRLQAQVHNAVNNHNWTALQQALVGYASLTPVARPVVEPVLSVSGNAAAAESSTPLTPEIKEQVARLVDQALPATAAEADTKLAELSGQLQAYLRMSTPDVTALKAMLSNFNFKLSFVAEEQAAIRTTLLSLLHLIFENIAELSLDEQWLRGQMEGLKVAATPPLSLRRMEELESRLKDVIFKQSEAKARTLEAQEEMKRTLAAFIERLARMTETNTSFGGKIESCAKRLETATSLADIAPVLQEAVDATRAMALDTQRTGEELGQMREKAQAAEAQIVMLQNELDKASAQARHDPLTGALNRKGLDDAMHREISTMQRKGSQLCVALLDIDNFKKLNDSLGHDTGDAALVHLAQVARDCLRPQDSLSRYGGEEFVILLPGTTLEQAVEAMARLQRELTKRFFLSGTEKVLITFSAGVAQVSTEENGADAVKRADQGMYLAKRSGKNRVVAV